MNFMSEFFAAELEEDMAKIEEYKKLKMPKNYTPQLVAPPAGGDEEDDASVVVVPAGRSTARAPVVIVAVTLLVAVLGVVGWFIVRESKRSATLLVDSNVFATIVDLDPNTMHHKRCETPCKIEGIMPGQHEIELRREGYLTKRETIMLKEGETQKKVVTMYRAGEQKTYVTVKSEPAGAQIFVNDKDSQMVTPNLVEVPVGIEVIVRLEKEGYQPAQQNLGIVAANENRQVSFIMKPLSGFKPVLKKEEKVPEPKIEQKQETSREEGLRPDRAYLTVLTTPSTFVYINEKPIQSTPLHKYELPPGEHKVRIRNQAYNIDRVIPVDIKPGQHEKIVRNLFQ